MIRIIGNFYSPLKVRLIDKSLSPFSTANNPIHSRLWKNKLDYLKYLSSSVPI